MRPVEVAGRGDGDLDVVGDRGDLEVGLDFELELELGARLGQLENLDREERPHSGFDVVGHQLELSVGRHEFDHVFLAETLEVDALVHFDVFEVDAQRNRVFLLRHRLLVVEPQVDRRHAWSGYPRASSSRARRQ